MARAAALHDSLAANRITIFIDPSRICIQMTVAPPATLDAFPSVLQGAESWIRDRWCFQERDFANTTHNSQSTGPDTSLKIGLKLIQTVVPCSNPVVEVQKPNDAKLMEVDQHTPNQ
ncbi:unnamed protein product [Trichobilharzia regenti]|nr:unnamed protein product [Trichobilharzia regenti]